AQTVLMEPMELRATKVIEEMTEPMDLMVLTGIMVPMVQKEIRAIEEMTVLTDQTAPMVLTVLREIRVTKEILVAALHRITITMITACLKYSYVIAEVMGPS